MCAMRWLWPLLWILFVDLPAHAALQRWDALPAFDPLHLQGVDAGTRTCPMCRYGYDAGLVLFLPAGLAPVSAQRLAQAIDAATRDHEDPRLRVFVVFTGGAPSPTLRALFAADAPTRFVLQLDGEALYEAQRDFEGLLDPQTASGYVFAQRRLLRAFDASQLLTADFAPDLSAASALLRELHPVANPDRDPDAPQGRLWLAPSRLREAATLSSGASAPHCFASADAAASDALIALQREGEPRVHWLRSDARGCITLSAAAGTRFDAEVFSPPQAAVRSARVHAIAPPEPIVGGCEGCEAAFDARPASLAPFGRIASPDEPGEPMRIDGRVTDAAGQAMAGAIVYAYQTDHLGEYPRGDAGLGAAARLHGRLRGWVQTGADGRYAFDTIRPGAYPGRDTPAHVHLHLIEPGRCSYWLDDLIFDDDPLVDLAHERARRDARGGPGLATPQRDALGVWRVRRDIEAGRAVPGHAACAATASAPPPG